MHRSTLRTLAVAVACVIGAPLATQADTIARYRFENDLPAQPAGPSTAPLVLDSSGHDFHLTPSGTLEAVAHVPDDFVPRTGEKNTRSLHFTGTGDVYSAAACGLSRVTFTSFTIEAWVRFEKLDSWQTFIGRDDAGNPGEGTGAQSLFYLSKSTDIKPGPGQTENGLRVELVTRDNRIIAINSTLGVVTETWYHVAVVGDAQAGTLSLYVDGVKIGSATGFTGLFIPKHNTAWTFGRGQYKGKPIDFFNGCLDEVRFSDTALEPSQFLNASKGFAPPASVGSAVRTK